MKKPAISVIIPTFNESEHIVPLLIQISRILRRLSNLWEIIVVDDNSPDGTAKRVREAFRHDRHISCHVRTGVRGLGASILLGVTRARGDILVGMDADGNHDPDVLPDMLVALRHADLVVASRFVRGGGMESQLRYFTSKYFNALLRIRYNFPVADNTSGYYAIRKHALDKLHPKSIYIGYGDYHMRLVYTAMKNGLVIKEIPVYYRNRRYGQSKSNMITMVGRYLRTAGILYSSPV